MEAGREGRGEERRAVKGGKGRKAAGGEKRKGKEGKKRQGEKKQVSLCVCSVLPWVLGYITCAICFCFSGSDSCLFHLQPKESVLSVSSSQLITIKIID